MENNETNLTAESEPETSNTSNTGNIGEQEQSEATNAQGDAAVVAEPDTLADSAQMQIEPEPQLPPHFEPIPEEKIKKAKRTKTVLIVIITLLVLALLGMGVAVAYVYFEQQTAATTINPTIIDIELEDQDIKVQDKGTLQTTELPNLVQMFGKTTNEALSILGKNYTLVKTEAIQEPENPDVKQLSTITYAPEQKQANAVVSAQTQNIYLSLNEEGQTLEVYLVSSMDLLGYQMATFSELTHSKDMVIKTLTSAGTKLAADFAYTVPKLENYTQYVDPEAKDKRVKKESDTVSGNLDSETAPTSFSLTFTYDYGATGVADTPDKKPAQRSLYLRLK